MIKLPAISEKNSTQFYKDTHHQMHELLINSKANPQYREIISYCSTAGQLDDEKIKKLLIGDFTILNEAIDQIGIIENCSVNKEFERIYTNFSKRKLGRTWAEMIGVTVCPYCNRSYIFTSSIKGTRPQYDHFFPKSKYPYLALSMYNLIPCCAVCNVLKHDDDTAKNPIIYPYQDSYGNQAEFVENGVDADTIASWLGAAPKYEIKIRCKDEINPDLKKRIEQAVKTFRLEDLYSKHSDYVRDILRTAYIYHDDYVTGLVTQFPDLFHSKEEAKNFVFFNYLEEKDWGKRVLAKLTHDLAQEVNS